MIQRWNDPREYLQGSKNCTINQQAAEIGRLKAEIVSLQDRLRAAHGGCRMLSEGSMCDCGLCKRGRDIYRLQAELVDAAEGATAAGAIIKARDAKIERLKWIQDWLARQLSNRTGRSMSNHIIEANEAYGRLAKLPGKEDHA